MTTYSTEDYAEKRQAYWDAQREFRAAAVAQIESLMGDSVEAVMFHIAPVDVNA